MYTYNNGKFRRISKAAAKKLFKKNQRVWVLPNNLNPASPWNHLAMLDTSEDFDSQVNYATCMMCTCQETGKYLSFYTEA